MNNQENANQNKVVFQAYSEEEYQAHLEEQEIEYQDSVRNYYVSRGYANIY
jgi:hypothetical protein